MQELNRCLPGRMLHIVPHRSRFPGDLISFGVPRLWSWVYDSTPFGFSWIEAKCLAK